MITEYTVIDPVRPQAEIISRAAQLIKAGQLVAFPTETVYGLGADALNPGAVAKIFQAKGRPQENPLLIHVSRREQVERLAREVPDQARILMDRFWPGPLSIILESLPLVPAIVRNGQAGVGFRMPSHPVAKALIDAAGPLAAPSANLYGRPSPINAEQVKSDLDGKIAAVLDAGSTGAGMESTVIDLSRPVYTIIRQGSIEVGEIEAVLQSQVVVAAFNPAAYRLQVKVVPAKDQADFQDKLQQLTGSGFRTGIICFSDRIYCDTSLPPRYLLASSGQGDAFYTILRDAESAGLEVLLVEPWQQSAPRPSSALIDRILRASQQHRGVW